MRCFHKVAFSTMAVLLLAWGASAATYEADPSHSKVGFQIRHLVSQVPGSFNDFTATIEYYEKKPEKSSVKAEIKTVSIDTDNEKRDAHLRGEDFFDVEKHPTTTFESTKVKKVDDDTLQVEGILNLHGVEKPVTLDVEVHGTIKNPWGKMVAGFTATTTINRKDFGIEWNKALDQGGFMLGDDVKLTINIEAAAKE